MQGEAQSPDVDTEEDREISDAYQDFDSELVEHFENDMV